MLVFLAVGLGSAWSAAAPAHVGFWTRRNGAWIESATRYPTEQTAIDIQGLLPATRYTVRAELDYGGALYRSSADFISDWRGRIRTDRAAPLAGSYRDADPDGFFWSMVVAGTTAKAAPLYRFTVEKEGTPVTAGTLPLGLLRPGVRAIPLDGTGLVGTLYLPAARGPRPAVIAFGGSEGGAGTGEADAVALANAGYVGLGVAYFGAAGLPAQLSGIPLEYFGKAIDFLRARAEVRRDRIAVMGMSRGGELALLLGATFPEIAAVVAQVPSPVRWAGNTAQATLGNWPPAWTYGGVALAYLSPSVWPTPIALPDGRTAYNERPVFEAGLQDAAGAAAATTAIENTAGPILMWGGDADEMWPSCELVRLAVRRLAAKGHPYADQGICYPGAGHLVGMIPGGPTSTTVVPEGGYWLNLGGDPAAIAAGQRDAWNRTLALLRARFGELGP